jgi:hypothetical protein
VLLLCVVAVALRFFARAVIRRSSPLVVVLIVLAVYSALPVLAIGRHVLADVSDVGIFTIFRSTGRFFWPVAYAILASAVGTVVVVLRPFMATLALTVALALQMVDVSQWWLDMHRGSRADAFFEWDMPLRSPSWHEILPKYQHVRLYFPEHCRDRTAIAGAGPAYLAGLYGLTLNDGFAARVDTAKQAEACEQLQLAFVRGFIDDATVYVMAPPTASEFEARLGVAAVCRPLDGVVVCVSRRSIAPRPGAL